MDLSNFIPQISAMIGLQPSTLLFLVGIVYLVAKATSRLIPDTATGWKATVRDIAGAISVDISSRIAPGVTIAAVAKAAADTPPIPAKIAEEAAPEVTP